jgi:preprotein translocase subunit SecF
MELILLETIKLFKGKALKGLLVGIIIPTILLFTLLFAFAEGIEITDNQLIEIGKTYKKLDVCESVLEKEHILVSKYKEEIYMYSNQLEMCYEEVQKREKVIDKKNKVWDEKEQYYKDAIEDAKPSWTEKLSWASIGGLLVALLALI